MPKLLLIASIPFALPVLILATLAVLIGATVEAAAAGIGRLS